MGRTCPRRQDSPFSHMRSLAKLASTKTKADSPALMCTPQCVERAMAEPTVLVTPTHSAPRALAYSRAASVSAVSPDCGRQGDGKLDTHKYAPRCTGRGSACSGAVGMREAWDAV